MLNQTQGIMEYLPDVTGATKLGHYFGRYEQKLDISKRNKIKILSIIF